jgi:hypothetical protein
LYFECKEMVGLLILGGSSEREADPIIAFRRTS